MSTNKQMKNQIFRDGISQGDRFLKELEPDYVAVDERNFSDLFNFVKYYATKLNYYDESNTINGDWSNFFAGDVNQMVTYINDPESFVDDESTERQLSQPHLVLFFTFLQLLSYPQKQFRELTKRYLNFHYQDVLKLTTKPEVPDKVNVVFELATGEEKHLIEQGTLLDAGQDSEGINLNYATDEDIIVNQAQVASVKTILLPINYIGLKEIHLEDNRSDTSFEKMLRWVVGSPNQGDKFPDFDGAGVNIQVLKENFYGEIKSQETAQISEKKKDYILNQLFFVTIENFKYCFGINDREINQEDVEVEKPTELEWEEVYQQVENAYKKKINFHRRKTLQEKREESGFDEMMEYALGHPNSGDYLAEMPNDYTTLDEIFNHITESAVITYINEELYMSVANFSEIMEIKNTGEEDDWPEVYRLVEKAETKKRNFTYPPVGKTEIQNICAGSIADAKAGEVIKLERFNTLGNSTQLPEESVGFAVASPLFLLPEGSRTITLTFATPGNTLDRDIFQEILDSGVNPFEVYLSSAKEWIQPESFKYEIGGFIVEAALKSYANTEISLNSENGKFTSVSLTNDTFTLNNIGQVLVWNDGNIFEITGLVSENEANIQEIGQGNFSVDDEDNDRINLYWLSAICLDSLQLQLTFDASQPEILPPSPDESNFFMETPYPLVKIMLKQIPTASNSQEQVIYYEQLKSLCVEKVKIEVRVENIQDLQLRNDNSIINPKNPFQPFGNNPKPGASFYFANPEISHKKLDSLTINLEWMGLPDNFTSHYQAYSDTGVISEAIANDSFQASLKLFNKRVWVNIGSSQAIFAEDDDNNLTTSINLNYQDFNIPGYSLNTSTIEIDSDDPLDQSRYFKLELEPPDFAHDLYPIVLNKVALATDEEIKSLTVYPPYTPEVKSISLNYTASEEIDFQIPPEETHPYPSLEGSFNESSKIFQIHPFGYGDIRSLNTDNQYYLLPQYPEQGGLYIGIRNVQPPENISILLQMVSGSGNGELTPPKIDWSYLSGNTWQKFLDTEILSDTTNGLLDTGIIHLSIPDTATTQHNLLPSNLHWIRATVKENTAALPDTIDIRTQAVRATFVNQENAANHLSKPLAANSIQGFVTRNPVIKTVEQPYTSFGGKPQEDNRTFTMRVSERLRHKQRAITAWDYERLVLEQFPEIYKVKCIPSAVSSDTPSAAKVILVVVPDISNTAPFFPLEPKAPVYLLQEIQEYLQKYTSPFVQIVVRNPRYERIKYQVGIRFRHGYEQGYYLNQLNEDIKHFLSPWAYEEQADIPFGSSIHNSSVVYFIEKRPYVDYVANLKLYEQVVINLDVQDKLDNYSESNVAQVQYPDSILVSAPEHIIEVV